jgi:hypothetical protein
VWRNKKGTGFVDFEITCLPRNTTVRGVPCTRTVRGLLQARKKKMGLIPIAVMKWMTGLFVFLGAEDDRVANPMGSIAIGTFLFQKMKGLLDIKGDGVSSRLEFPPLFLPSEVPVVQHLLSRHTD